MSTQHTPGPWRLGKPSDAVVADHDSGHDDSFSIDYYGGHLIAESIQPSNRALIAAAPDLLAALIEMRDLFDLMCGLGFNPAEGRDGSPKANADAAIAKATGEQA